MTLHAGRVNGHSSAQRDLGLLITWCNALSHVQMLWMSSIYLESVAILPQLTLLMRTENIDNLTGNYVFLLGAYRSLYILNWIYRYFTETHYQHWLGAIPIANADA